MDEEIEIEIFESIEQVSRTEWDSVADQSISVNYAMLLCAERNLIGAGEPRYFLVREAGSTMAVSAAIVSARSEGHTLVSRLFGRLAGKVRPVAGSLDRAMVCGGIPGPGPAVVVRSNSDQQRWTRIICSAMENHARSLKIHMAYTGSQSCQSVLSRELNRRGFLRGLDLPVSTLNVTWQNMDTYIKVLRARKSAYGIKAVSEMRRFNKSGIKISRWRGGDSTDQFDLLRKHNEQRNSGSFHFRPGFLNDLVAELGDDCIIYEARCAETLIGVCVILRRGNEARTWLVGIDHTADGNNFTYFNLTFYHPCSEFPALGIRRVHYGNAVQYTKYRRGCDVVQTHFFVKPHYGTITLMLRPIFSLQRFSLGRKFRAQFRLGSGKDS